MSTIWAVARHMISEGVRMKIAVVFLVLIGLVVLGLPFSITGDGSLTGAVQSFLSYSLSATGLLLGLLTIFLSRSLSDELVQRQILLVMTKPVHRWQFILGKWLGATLLNAMFLTFTGLAVYGMVHYIRYAKPPIDDHFDKAELVNEVLVARHAIPVTLPDFRQPAEAEFDRNVEQGLYDNVPDFNPQAEKARLAKKYEARWRVVQPQDAREFFFENVLCERLPNREIQIRYKTEVSEYPPDEVYRSFWRFGDPLKGTPVYEIPTRHVVGRFHTIGVPADAVASDNTLTVRFLNINPFAGERQFRNYIEFRAMDGLELMFVVGTFEWNLVRLLILVLCKLMFLAAVAFFAATIFSFPVACLASFTIYVLAATRGFIGEALTNLSLEGASIFSSAKEFFAQSLELFFSALHWIVPNFARYDALENLVTGRNVSLVWVLQGIADLVLLKCVIVLGLAMLLFQRREVAEISL